MLRTLFHRPCRAARAALRHEPSGRLSSRIARKTGAVLVYIVFLLIAMIGFVGLGIDWAYTFWVAGQLQTAADSAALAGVQHVYTDHAQARAAAIELAASNFAGGTTVALADNPSNDPGGDVVIGVYDPASRSFAPSTDRFQTNAVRVRARRETGSVRGPLSLFFGPIFGRDSVDVARFAIAFAEGGPAHSDIIALNLRDPMSFYLHGDAYLEVRDGEGAVQVNSSNTTNNVGASLVQGTNLTFLAGEVNVVGMQYERGRPTIPPTNEFQSVEPDPYADLPEPIVPSSATYPATPAINNTGQYYPGYYPGGIDLTNGMNAFLHPGVYILGNGLHIRGDATLRGYEVMLYIDSGNIETGNGNSQVYLTPPSDGVYEGVQIFQARDNTATAKFAGGTTWDGAQVDDPSTPDVDESAIGMGAIYLPAAKYEFGGTGDMTFTGLVADKVEIYGTGNVYVSGGGDSQQGVTKIYLVE